MGAVLVMHYAAPQKTSAVTFKLGPSLVSPGQTPGDVFLRPQIIVNSQGF